MKKNYNDIINWRNPPKNFFEHLSKEFGKRDETYFFDLRELGIDHKKLYCLLKAKISDFPNGYYAMLMEEKPIGNIFWWDFLLDSDLGFIHFYRSESKIEVMTNLKEMDFSILEFIKFNFNKYSKDINDAKKSLETHKLYVNHYHSYSNCVVELNKEIVKLKISPEDVEKIISENKNLLEEALNNFVNDNIKFHALAKSLLLNSAFLIEAYINLLIRLSAKPDLKEYPDILNKHLSSTFRDKLKNLKYYSIILKEDVDLENQIVKDALEVINYRNKYVHSDLSSKLNEIGEVNFDGYFPVFNSYKYSPIIENITRTYQTPSKQVVEFCYFSSLNFIQHIDSLFKDIEVSGIIRMIMNQNPIGFNVDSKNYSAIFSNIMVDARFEK